MTLAARCPWCETVFRLTEGQVAAKAGMARCGVCSHTFNVLDALLSDSAVAALERGAQAREASQEAALRASTQAARLPAAAAPLPSPGPAQAQIIAPAPPKPAHASLLSVPSFLWRKAVPLPLPPPAPGPPDSTQAVESTSAAPSIADAPALGEDTIPGGLAPPPEPRVGIEQPTTRPENNSLLKSFEPIPLIPAPAGLRAEAAPPVPSKEPSSAMGAIPAMALWKSDALPAQALQSTQAIASLTNSEETPALVSAVAPGTDYQIDLPNYDAERIAAEPVDKSEAVEAMRVEDHRAAIRAVRSAALGSSAIGPHSDKADDDGEDHNQHEVGAAEPDVSQEHEFPDIGTELEPDPVVIPVHEPAPVATPSLALLHEDERLGPPTFQPSFLQVPERAGPSRVFLRLIGWLLCLVLIVALAAQSAYWWRTELVIHVPQSKIYLAQFCARLHCDIEPPAEIDQLSIESSELLAVAGIANTLSFSALVRNHSSSPMSYPAIEVTLTDAHDQAILRRVFSPQDYLADASKQRLLAGIAGNSEFSLKLTFNTSGVATTGYRAGIFYP